MGNEFKRPHRVCAALHSKFIFLKIVNYNVVEANEMEQVLLPRNVKREDLLL